jgi:hypothetical protein
MDNWPPILCPRCMAMRFTDNAEIAQCVYCGFVLTRWGISARMWLLEKGMDAYVEMPKSGQNVRFLGIGKKET